MKPRFALAVLLFLLAGIGNFALSTVRAHLQTNPAIAGILDPTPLEIGRWTGEPTEVDSAIIKGPPGVVTRTIVYRQEETGQLVWMALCVGPPGLVTEELPEKTYRFIGYAYDNESKRYESLRVATDGKVDGTLARMNFWSQQSSAPMSVWHGWFDGRRCRGRRWHAGGFSTDRDRSSADLVHQGASASRYRPQSLDRSE